MAGKCIETQQSLLEDQLSKLHQYEKTVQGYKPHIDELESINQVGGVIKNKYC